MPKKQIKLVMSRSSEFYGFDYKSYTGNFYQFYKWLISFKPYTTGCGQKSSPLKFFVVFFSKPQEF